MGFRNGFIIFLTLILFTAPLALSADQTQMQVRVYFSNKAQLLTLQQLHPDIVYRGKGFVEVITDADKLSEIERLGMKTETVHKDVVSFYRSRIESSRDMGGFKTLAEINSYLDQMLLDHPSIMSDKISLGTSVEGRDIWAVKISDNPDVNEEEPEILYVGAIHAREVITPEVLFYYMDWLTDNYGTDPEATAQVDEREIWFVPCMNVDGYYHNQVIEPNGGGMWRKNRRDNGDGTYGVDLNRNYSYEWGYDNVGSSPYTYDATYRGPSPFSEPETQALRDFTAANEFVIVVYYHSYSNLILWPWGYDEFYTPEQTVFKAMGDSMATFNNYNPTAAWGLYVANGTTDDWGYGETTIKNRYYAFTFEVGGYSDGFWPPLSRVPELVSENLGANIALTNFAGNVYGVLPPAMPVLDIPDSTDSGDYTVNWNFDDTANPADAFELIELKNSSKITDSCDDFDNFDNEEFTVNPQIYHSAYSSFYSGAENNRYRYFQTKTPYQVRTLDKLIFWTRYNIEDNYDYAYVEVSTDGVNFTSIQGNITTTYDPYGNNRGHGITGESGGWIEAEFPLSDYDGQSIYIRFSYDTDASLTESGIYFDDIYPIFEFEYETVLASDIADEFYNVTGREPGTYYYRVRAQDVDGQWGAFSDLDAISVYEPWICGDADNNLEVDILDIIYLIDYKFNEGPAPQNPQAADVNADGNIDILDILYLIDFKFDEGPEPACN